MRSILNSEMLSTIQGLGPSQQASLHHAASKHWHRRGGEPGEAREEEKDERHMDNEKESKENDDDRQQPELR